MEVDLRAVGGQAGCPMTNNDGPRRSSGVLDRHGPRTAAGGSHNQRRERRWVAAAAVLGVGLVVLLTGLVLTQGSVTLGVIIVDAGMSIQPGTDVDRDREHHAADGHRRADAGQGLAGHGDRRVITRENETGESPGPRSPPAVVTRSNRFRWVWTCRSLLVSRRPHTGPVGPVRARTSVVALT